MKTLIALVLLVLCSTTISTAQSRMENAFQTGFQNVTDLPSNINLRLEDSLYSRISGPYALQLIQKYFKEKDSLAFHFTSGSSLDNSTDSYTAENDGMSAIMLGGSSGTLVYSTGGRRWSVNVDVWWKSSTGGIDGINISNYSNTNIFHKKTDHVDNTLIR
jgi:hypothetical protein